MSVRTYEEVIEKIGEQMLHTFLGGGYNLLPSGLYFIGYVYDVSYDSVVSDAEASFERQKTAHYESMK
jgi:hypothetical protein